MSDSRNPDYLDLLIANQYRAIRFYWLFAGGLVILGFLIIIFSQFYPGINPDTLKILLGIGGGFISSLSAFQIKEILIRKEKAETFKMLKIKRPILEKTQDEAGKEEHKRIDAAIWQAVEKIVVSN